MIDLSPSDLNDYKDKLTNKELPKAITDRLANSKCPAAQIPAVRTTPSLTSTSLLAHIDLVYFYFPRASPPFLSVQPPAPTTVTDEVIAMPAPSPPAPTFVMYGQVDIDGCPPQQADSAAFADQVTSTIAQYSKVPPPVPKRTLAAFSSRLCDPSPCDSLCSSTSAHHNSSPSPSRTHSVVFSILHRPLLSRSTPWKTWRSSTCPSTTAASR